MTREKRSYQMRRRAELQERTRLLIVDAAVRLHGTLGPSRTTISAVAALAGVRRSTVYRHFPDEAALFAACSSHWVSANPPPELARWAAIDDADKRLDTALADLYPFYRATAQMLDNILRDEETMPVVRQHFAGFRDYLSAAAETLIVDRRARGPGRRRLRAAVGHALAFTTWRSLTLEYGLSDSEAADLMHRLVASATERS